jgi:hypothetical protein
MRLPCTIKYFLVYSRKGYQTIWAPSPNTHNEIRTCAQIQAYTFNSAWRLLCSNVKTVKDRRSINVPTSNRNETKMSWVFIPCPIERDHAYLVQENGFWTKSKQSFLNKTNSWNNTKMFWFSFQNDIGTFVPSFLTLLLLRGRIKKIEQGILYWGRNFKLQFIVFA